MPILEKKIVIFGKMIVFTLDNNDALGGSRLGGAESNPKLQVNLNLNARELWCHRSLSFTFSKI